MKTNKQLLLNRKLALAIVITGLVPALPEAGPVGAMPNAAKDL